MNVVDVADFYVSVLDSLSQQIAVIDAQGFIQWVNRSWRTFSEENGGEPDKAWRGTNYLNVCGSSADSGNRDGRDALTGIEKVIEGKQSTFYFEYPCHSPTEQRWFMMRIHPLNWNEPKYFVVTHENITERKLAEIRVGELAVLDGLTGIANRQRFDDFLEDEWRRARRLGHPVSMALCGIDFFKPYNDNYGHMAGDECLRRVSEALKPFARRPDDLVARYGGEEFAMVLGTTEEQPACKLAEKIRATIQALNILHEHATPAGCVTISVGVATLRPETKPDASPHDLIEAADQALYKAKRSGRNRAFSKGGQIQSNSAKTPRLASRRSDDLAPRR
jgi:diguanylate cyclase (GGDEF)-like protein